MENQQPNRCHHRIDPQAREQLAQARKERAEKIKNDRSQAKTLPELYAVAAKWNFSPAWAERVFYSRQNRKPLNRS